MKQTRIIFTALIISASAIAWALVPASPSRFMPDVQGYIQRARSMRDAGNFGGVIDQLGHIFTQMTELSPRQREECLFMLADAYFQRGDSECLRLLTDFCRDFPASPYATEAALKIGDFYFFSHDWPDALEAYKVVDFNRLNRDDRPLYTYRKALAMIKTGHFREARPLIGSLKGISSYADVYNFYEAYLDYIDGKFKDAYNRFMRVTPGIEGLEAGYYMTQIEYTWGKYADVISHGRSLLFKRPIPELAPELNRIVGLSYFKTGEPDVAYGFLSNYLEQVNCKPADDAVYALGAIDYQRGDYSLAQERLTPLAELNDAVGQGALLYLGLCYLKEGNTSSAAIAFEKAGRLDFDPEVSETALYNYVTAVTRGGKVPFSSSSKLLERFVSTYPESEYAPEVESYLATAYYNDRDFKKALQYIDAIRQPSASQLATRQKILYELGIETVTNGKPEEAVGYLRQAVELKRFDKSLGAQASLWLGDALFSLNRFKEAQTAYEDFVADRSSNLNRALGLYDLAYTKYKLKNYSGAAADFAAALSTRPELPSNLANDARIRRGDCLYYIGRYPEATALFTQAIENNAIDADYALYRRALIRGISGDRSAKLADLSLLEKNFPDSRWLSKSLLEQALAYEEAGRSDLAADAYKKRLGIVADIDIDELLRMASAMHQAGRNADLLEVIDRIKHAGGLEADELAEISLFEAEALFNSGRKNKALEIYSQLAQTPSSEPGSHSAVALAEAAIQEGDFAKAKVLMEEFTENGSPHQYWLARGFIALADAYHGLGQNALAREYLSSLRDNYPGNNDDIDSRISSRLNKWK